MAKASELKNCPDQFTPPILSDDTRLYLHVSFLSAGCSCIQMKAKTRSSVERSASKSMADVISCTPTLHSDAPGSSVPVLHRLPRPAGGDTQRTIGAAYVCHSEPAAALPLRPQPHRHGRPAASGPAQVGAHSGGHVHFGKVSFEWSHVTGLTSVRLRLVKTNSGEKQVPG